MCNTFVVILQHIFLQNLLHKYDSVLNDGMIYTFCLLMVAFASYQNKLSSLHAILPSNVHMVEVE